MNLRMVILLLALFSSSGASGAVTVTPASPSSTDTITIRVENHFGSEAHVTSASMTAVGNAFTIHQNVEIVCTLPSDPLVASQFQVGPLAAGAYTVTANIIFTGLGFPNLPCSPPPITQTAAFTVAPDAAIPAVDGRVLVLLGTTLAATALWALGVKP